MRTTFEYLYRDAANFKSFGSIVLDGRLEDADREAIREKLHIGDNFIAEQVGVPPLYDQLYQWSDGPTDADHCWHEFVGFREISEGASATLPADELIARFEAVGDWDQELSPHFRLVDPEHSRAI